MPADLESVWKVIVDVKPSVAEVAVDSGASLLDDLGLDSLDMLQLGRKLGRVFEVSFVMTEWLARERLRSDKKMTVGSLVETLQAARGG